MGNRIVGNQDCGIRVTGEHDDLDIEQNAFDAGDPATQIKAIVGKYRESVRP